MSESIEMCKIVHFYGFPRPIFRVHPAPKVHDFAIRCMNFSSHFEHLRIDKGSRGVICTLSLMSWIYVSYHIPYIHSNNYSKDQYELNKI